MLIGTLVNTAAVILGALIGMGLGNVLPERLRTTVMSGLGLCTLFVGISGTLGGENQLITIISMVIGAIIGELCDLDGHLNRFAEGLEKKFRKTGGKVSLAEGFVTASLLFCVGAMAPVLQANPAVIPEMTVVGSLLIIGISLNMLGVTKLKVMNYVPAIFIPIALCQFM